MPSLSTNPAQSNRLFSNTFNFAGLLPLAISSRLDFRFTGRRGAGFDGCAAVFEL